MAKWHGVVGYVVTEETRPGVWVPQPSSERKYYGDVIRNVQKVQSSGGVNDDLNISNQISILSDPYANKNFQFIAYVEFMGTKWKVTNVEVLYPRLILSIGGVYNGK